MGVHGLGKLLSTRGQIQKQIFSDLSGTVQVVDTYGMLYRFMIGVRQMNEGMDILTTGGKPVSHLHAIFHKACLFLRHNILPCFVFDGPPPLIKRNVLKERRQIRASAETKLKNKDFADENERLKLLTKTVSIKEIDVIECRNLLSLLGLPNIQAIGEAEAQCAALSKANIVDGVISCDYDALLFGSKIVVMDASNKKPIRKLELKNILSNLDLTLDQLIDLCAILGNDFCEGIKGLTPVIALKEFTKADKSMARFLENIRNINMEFSKQGKKPPYQIPDDFEKKWIQSKKYYTSVKVLDPRNAIMKPCWNKPNIPKLYDYLCNVCEFNKDIVKKKLAMISRIYNQYKKNNSILINNYSQTDISGTGISRTVTVDSNTDKNMYIKCNIFEDCEIIKFAISVIYKQYEHILSGLCVS